MRWPFGPPHLTLKPSKKNKTKKKQQKQKKTKTNQEPTPKTIQQQNKNKANKTETKAKQTPKTNTRNTRNTKTPKPSKPKNKQEEATPEKPKKLGKKSILTLLELCQTHQKQTTITLKPQKNKPKKHHFAMFKNNRLFFINFLFFSACHFCFWKAVFCWKHYKNSAFSKTQLFKNTVSKTHFFHPCQKNTFFKEKVSFLGFGQFPLKPLFL